MTRSAVGSVSYVRPGVWRIRVQHGRGPDGRPLVRTETFHGTEREARLRAAVIASEMGTAQALPRMTLGEYYWGVFRSKPSNRGTPRAPNTLRYYDCQMKGNVLPALGGVRLDRITHEMVATCVRASSAPENTRRTLRAVLRSAYDDGLTREDVSARRIPVAKRHRERVRPWDVAEVRAALDASGSAPDAVGAYLALGLCGLREEEALGMRACDVTSGGPSVLVSVRCTYTDQGGLVPRGKNAHALRTVPVPSPCAAAVADAASTAMKRGGPRARLVPLRGDRLYVLWKRWISDSGLRFVPPGTLRHSTDTIMLSAGVPPDLDDALHGRSQHATTYGHYYRPSAPDMEAAVRALSSALGGTGPGERG